MEAFEPFNYPQKSKKDCRFKIKVEVKAASWHPSLGPTANEPAIPQQKALVAHRKIMQISHAWSFHRKTHWIYRSSSHGELQPEAGFESLVFLQHFLLKINKMLPLFNFSIKAFARIDTLNIFSCIIILCYFSLLLLFWCNTFSVLDKLNTWPSLREGVGCSRYPRYYLFKDNSCLRTTDYASW